MKRRVPFLEPSEVEQLKLFGWFLLLINGCIVAGAFALGVKLDNPTAGWVGVAVLAVVVDGAFGLIVGVNVTVVAIRRWRRRRS